MEIRRTVKEAEMHKHRKKYETDTAYSGPVRSHRQNRKAHGGICVIEVCSCNAVRKVNKNAGAVERGEWVGGDYDEQEQ